jgi:hypothetical protein
MEKNMRTSNTRCVFILLICAVLTITLESGCATASVLKWSGQSEFDGKGGAFQTIDGIDFYTAGEPKGRYRVLSLMQGAYYRGGSLLMSSLSKKKAINMIVKEARAEGADAAVIVSAEYQVLGSSTTGSGYISPQGQAMYSSGTQVHGQESGTVALVKYIEVKR